MVVWNRDLYQMRGIDTRNLQPVMMILNG